MQKMGQHSLKNDSLTTLIIKVDYKENDNNYYYYLVGTLIKVWNATHVLQHMCCNSGYRVGNGVSPVTSHTTGHTVPYHGGSLR